MKAAMKWPRRVIQVIGLLGALPSICGTTSEFFWKKSIVGFMIQLEIFTYEFFLVAAQETSYANAGTPYQGTNMLDPGDPDSQVGVTPPPTGPSGDSQPYEAGTQRGFVNVKLPNIDYLGLGYDVFRGNPFGTSMSPIDQGYRESVLQFSYTSPRELTVAQ